MILTAAPYHKRPFRNMKKTSRKFFSGCFFILQDLFNYSVYIFSFWITANSDYKNKIDRGAAEGAFNRGQAFFTAIPDICKIDKKINTWYWTYHCKQSPWQ